MINLADTRNTGNLQNAAQKAAERLMLNPDIIKFARKYAPQILSQPPCHTYEEIQSKSVERRLIKDDALSQNSAKRKQGAPSRSPRSLEASRQNVSSPTPGSTSDEDSLTPSTLDMGSAPAQRGCGGRDGGDTRTTTPADSPMRPLVLQALDAGRDVGDGSGGAGDLCKKTEETPSRAAKRLRACTRKSILFVGFDSPSEKDKKGRMETWVKQNGGAVALDAKECTVCVSPRSLFSLTLSLSPSLSLSIYPW